MRKQIIAGLLAVALAIAPALAVFPDVTDPQLNEAVEILRQLEVVNGKPGGTFDPAGTFTRGEFCKMALTILGRAEERQLYTGRVIFSDVTAAHWALGWINAAAVVREGVTPLVRGRGDGRFCPDDAISCGEAVTILMRCLGYSDADVGDGGGAWYAGALLRAKSIGLMDGLNALDGDDVLTRAQAALLFENLLFTSPKDSKDFFLQTVLGGSVGKAELVLEVKGKALSAGGWVVKTDKASYVTFRSDLSPTLQGRMCKPVTDKDGNILTLQIDEDYTTRAVHIRSAEARYVVEESGQQTLVPTGTPVWRSDKDAVDYAGAYKEILPGTNALFCYDKTDTLVSIYLTVDSATAITAVAGEGSRPFDGAWQGTPKAVYKNGVAAALSAVEPYDVGTYDPRTGVLELSDKKLTGVYENAVPSPVSPDSITVMGCDGLEVLDCALDDLARFQLGDRVTLLLDGRNRVAGVVSPDKAEGRAIGLAKISRDEEEFRGDKIYYTYRAEVATTYGLTLKGKVKRVLSTNSGSIDQTMELIPGRITTVTSSELGWLQLSQSSAGSLSGDWDVKNMRLGATPVSPLVTVYDKAEDGKMTSVGLRAVTQDKVPADKISFVHMDNAGVVDVLALKNATGDVYSYGVTDYAQGSLTPNEWGGLSSSTSSSVTLTNGDGQQKLITAVNFGAKGMEYAGVAPSVYTRGGVPTLADWMPLTAHKGVHRTAFGEDSVTVDGVVWPLAGDIDNGCYNARSETWFKSLDAALAYTSTLTVYCDRSPAEGGKVRLVVAE